MSKIHALTSDNYGNTHVVIHAPMPVGNNAVGNSWQAVWLALNRNTTTLAEGVGLGQISSAERAEVVAGNVIEIIGIVPISVVAQGGVAVNSFVDALIASGLGALQKELNYFGWING